MALFDDNMFITYYENAVAVTGEQHVVTNGRCILDYVPDRFTGVIATINGTQVYYIKENQVLSTNLQFKVDFSNGWVTFWGNSRNGATVTFAYSKVGQIKYNANRIVSDQNEDHTIKETLDQLIDEVRLDNTTANDAEVIRISSESIRISSENTRLSQESNRVIAEGLRVSAENIRLSSEITRNNSENTRISQETARQTNISNFRHVGEWTSNLVISKNNICTYNGSSYLYISNTTSTTAQPTDDGITYELISAGGTNVRYRGTHEVGVGYIPLDVINYNNYQYINILATSSQLPTNATYWEVYNYTKIGELTNVITLSVATSQFNILIPEYNKNNDLIEIIQNSTRIWEGQQFSVSDYVQGRIDKIGEGNWNAETTFFIRILKNMRMTISLQDGNLIESGTIPLSSLDLSTQDAILANTQMVKSYLGTLTIPFESSVSDIDVSVTIPEYDYTKDALLLWINGRYPTLNIEYTKSANRILKVSSTWGGSVAGDSDTFDFIVLKSMANIPLETYSGSLITDASIANSKYSSLILQSLAGMNTTTGLIAQTGNSTFSKRTLTSSDTKLSITNPAGIAGNPTLTVNEDNLNFAHGLIQSQISTPSNPSSSYTKLYPKSDGKFYKLNSSGYESCIEYGISTKEIGLLGDGIVNDATKLNTWITSVGSTKVDLIVTSGTYLISTNVTFPANIRIVGMFGGMFKVSNGIGLNGNGTLLECGLWQIFDLSLGGVIGGTWGISEKSPVWFGAKFDNISNDTTAIQKTIDNMTSVENIICPQGTSLISEINLLTKNKIKGIAGNTTFKRISTYTTDTQSDYYRKSGMFNTYMPDDSIMFEDIVFEDLIIDGNLTNLTIVNGTKLATLNAHNLNIRLCNGFKVYNCIVKNAIHSGIFTQGCTNVDIKDCKVYFNGTTSFNSIGMSRNGISINGYWYNDTTKQHITVDKHGNKIDNCEIYSNCQEGIMFAYTRDITITRNEIYSNLDRAIEGDTSFVGGDNLNINISKNYIHDNVLSGITFGNAPTIQKLLIDGNIIENCGDFIVFVEQSVSGDVIVSNNICSGSGQRVGVNKGTIHSFYLNGSNIIFKDNICTQLELTAIAIRSFKTATIENNTFEQVSASSLYGCNISMLSNGECINIRNNKFNGYVRPIDFTGSTKTIDFAIISDNYSKDMDNFLQVGATITIDFCNIFNNYCYDTRGTVGFGNMISLLGNITTLNLRENKDGNALYQMISDMTKVTSLISQNNVSETRTVRFYGRPTIPTGGTHKLAEVVYNSNPVAGGNIGWVYTGTVWNTFGTIDLISSATYNPPSLTTGTQTSTTVTVIDASLGDEVKATFSLDLQLIDLTAYVSATNTVTCVFRNNTADTIDLGSGTLKVKVIK